MRSSVGLLFGVVLGAALILNPSLILAQPADEDSPVPTNAPPADVIGDELPAETPDTIDTPVTEIEPEAAAPEPPAEAEVLPPEPGPPTPAAPASLPPISIVLTTAPPAVPAVSREDFNALAGRLASLERTLTEQQSQTFDVMVDFNRTLLLAASVFAGLGLLAIVTAAYILVRALNRLSDIALTLPAAQQLGRVGTPVALGEGFPETGTSPVEQVSARFLGALEQLERRIRQLEHVPAKPSDGRNKNPSVAASPPAADTGSTQAETGIEPSPPTETPGQKPNPAVTELLQRGEELLSSDRGEEALECFEQAIVLEPDNAEALIRRGQALEKLQRMEAALESYNEAIARNSASTLAYLHKGAVCNRLQRYREALECYEKALQTEQRG